MFWGSQRLYVDFPLQGGWHPNPHNVQGSNVLWKKETIMLNWMLEWTTPEQNLWETHLDFRDTDHLPQLNNGVHDPVNPS